MKRLILWGTLGALLAAAAVLALTPSARHYVGSKIERAIQIGRDLIDPPLSAEALRPLLFDQATAVVLGPSAAEEAATIVAFVDYNCVFCRRQFRTFETMATEGRLPRVILRHLPHTLDSIALAQAMLAAKRQGKELALHRAMAAAEAPLGPADLPALATAAGLDVDRLRADAAAPDVEALLDADIKLAWKLRIRSTPTMIIAGKLIRGVHDGDAVRTALTQKAQP